ncbi:MAG: hypothetical protein M3063_14220 [Actinomycetota bacterium]|nr:hypothetical protein [Actinomycetota bacterium]
MFRENEGPRRPLRSTQEAKAVAARRQEQITGPGAGGEPAGPRPASETAPSAASPGDPPNGSKPRIRAAPAAASTESPSNDEPPVVEAPGTPRQGADGANGSGPHNERPGTEDSSADSGTSLANGTAPASAASAGEDTHGEPSRRRGLLRRGRTKRKSGEA